MLSTKRLYSRKTGERGEVVKYKCKFVDQGFRKIEELHHKESSSLTPVAATVYIALATAAVMDLELRHIDFEQAQLLADVDIEIYIKILEDSQMRWESSTRVSTALCRRAEVGT